MKKIIGITGGIASGKSTVTSFLTSRGYEVIDADAVVRELQQIGGALYVAIRDTFGPTYFLSDGELDRITFGQAIFSNPKMRAQLSMLQDKLIRDALFEKCQASQSDLVFMDIPLLFEKKYTGFDEIWLVYVPKQIQLARLMKRNNLSQADALLRIDSQIPIDEKCTLATRIIDNCDTIDTLESQLTTIISEI